MNRAAADERVLHIVADPNNLPFSDDKLEGFENKIAEIVARDLGMRIEYTWAAQRRGFFRENLKHGIADLVLGIPTSSEMALPTAPYYRSTFVFVTRADRKLDLHSLDDPPLHDLKIGVQLVGGDNLIPPAQALARRGIAQNVTGYMVTGDYRQEIPTADALGALVRGEIDVAIVWGPLAGYFAKRQAAAVQLIVTPVERASSDPPEIPFSFNIAMGVKRSNKALRQQVSDVLTRRKGEIDRILDDYGVPRAPALRAATTQANASN